jgi:DNA polymerase-3 subunit gamma/tau
VCGRRGVAKTTIARILARGHNCDKGPPDTRCGVCSSFTDLAAGTSTDVQEIDGASRPPGDDVRELIESIRYAPSPGKHRIYVVDEVHMLSVPAFNALLKTLEEPPPRSLFVFATTNPEKIPFTVTSRCQRYDLRRLPTAEVAARLGQVATAEGVTISARSLQTLARESQGSLRDGLTLLDQVIAVGGTEVDDDRVAQLLDLVDRHVLVELAAACVDGDPAGALSTLARASALGIEAKKLGAALLGVLRDLVVLRVAPGAPDLVEGSDAELDALRALADRGEPARVRRLFRALLREQEDLAWAPEPMAVLEMAVVRLATTASGDDVNALLTRLDALEQRLAGTGPPDDDGGGRRERGGSGSGGRARPPARARGRDASSEGAANGAPTSQRATQAPPEPAPTVLPAADRAGAAAAETSPRVPQRSPSTGADAPLPVVLDRLRAALAERDRGLAIALEGVTLLERTDTHLRFAVPDAFAARRLERRLADLEAACERFFGGMLRIELSGPTAASPTRAPAAVGGRPRPSKADEEADRRRRREALDHPAVNAALEILGGDVVEIRPLGGQAPGGKG